MALCFHRQAFDPQSEDGGASHHHARAARGQRRGQHLHAVEVTAAADVNDLVSELDPRARAADPMRDQCRIAARPARIAPARLLELQQPGDVDAVEFADAAHGCQERVQATMAIGFRA